MKTLSKQNIIDKKYKVGIVGLGRIATLFENDPKMDKPCTHAGAYTAHPRTELICGCDIRQDRLNSFREKWGVNRLYTDYKEMLKKEEIDILSICTHSHLHREICIEAAKSGVKAIFCEKPISVTLQEAYLMIRACEDNKVILAIDYTRRWDESFIKAKEILSSGKLGKIRTINGFCTAGFLNGGTHLFDLLRYLTNEEVIEVYGNIIEDGTIDPQGRALFKLSNGAECYVDSIYRNYILFGLHFYGEDGMMDTTGMIRGKKELKVFNYSPSTYQTGLNSLSPLETFTFEPKPPLVTAISDIINCIETGKKPECSGWDGYKATQIAIAIHQSSIFKEPVNISNVSNSLGVLSRHTSFTKDGELPE